MDELQEGDICPEHGEVLYEGEDPYAADVFNEPGVIMLGCDECFYQRAMDI
jgi:hypothetical protein